MESPGRGSLKKSGDVAPQLGLFADSIDEQAPRELRKTPAEPATRPLPARTRSGGLPAWVKTRTTPASKLQARPVEDDELFEVASEPFLEPARRVWRVGALVGEVRTHLEGAYSDVWVEGEVSNLRPAASGHLYFTLKDGDAQLPAVLFRRQAQLLRFRLEDGLQVLLRGRVSVYEQRGQMQLIGEYVEPVGAGSLQVAFEQLKARLGAEGLFAADRKRPLPRFPRCIGIVTSPAGAVIRDFLHVAGRRHAALEVLIYPAVVQGESAAAELAAGIAWFNRRDRPNQSNRSSRVDVVVVARGGGSLEDLAPFNSELLARAIAASELPVVSAVGHETDFVIADFVADLRAPTPSAAAELITEAQYTLASDLSSLSRRLERAGRYHMMMARQRLTAASIEAALARLRTGLNRREQRVDEQRFRLDAAIGGQLRRTSDRLQQLTARLARQDAGHRLQVSRERWRALEARLAQAGGRLVEHGRRRQELLASRLAALSPLSVLSRGYALVFDASGGLVKDAAAVDIGDRLHLQLGKGRIAATATEVTKEAE